MSAETTSNTIVIKSTHECDLRIVVVQLVIVRLVAAPPATVKANDPPEKVGHRGAETALLLHHFGGSCVTGAK